jgi:hypothetical protein
MGILDDAIREHLELKRQHGAADPELKKLEDEAFGPPERPGMAPEDASDPLAEAPTQFMAQPEVSEAVPSAAEKPKQRRETAAGILDLQEAPEPGEPAEEEQPAAEHKAVAEPEEAPPPEEEWPQAAEEDEVEVGEQGEDAEFAQEESDEPPAAEHSTEERQAIAEQPTEHYDVEEEFSVSRPSGEESAGAEPLPEDEEEEDDFFNEQRLSDELDQALEAPRESQLEEEPEPEDLEPEGEPGPDDLEPEEELEPEADLEPEEELEPEEDGEPEESAESEETDVLEGTPDFLEETPEDDELWFEQKPPKDFDFDD